MEEGSALSMRPFSSGRKCRDLACGNASMMQNFDLFLLISTATDLSTRRAFANPPPATPASPPAPALDVAAQQVFSEKLIF